MVTEKVEHWGEKNYWHGKKASHDTVPHLGDFHLQYRDYPRQLISIFMTQNCPIIPNSRKSSQLNGTM